MLRGTLAVAVVALCPLLSDTVATLVNTQTTLECHRREYTFKATRSDSKGNVCWDDITAMSCWGRCDSGEIADWRFPFKKSFHPVCTYDSRRLVKTQLRHCQPKDLSEEDELRVYEYLEALSCSCQVCDSTWTSCEGFRHPWTQLQRRPLLPDTSLQEVLNNEVVGDDLDGDRVADVEDVGDDLRPSPQGVLGKTLLSS